MSRFTDTLDFDDGAIRVTTEQLCYEDSEDLLPEVMDIVSGAFEHFAALVQNGEVKVTADDIMKLSPILGTLAKKIGGGRLRQLAPRILKTTSIVMPDPAGGKQKLDLVKKEDRAICFETRPDIYFSVLWFAGKVTFGRFFPASARRALKKEPTPTASS